MRIGLSTTSQGYYVIAPLIHAVTVVCVGIVLMFMWSSGGQGYVVARPPQLRAGKHIDRGGEVVDKAAGEAAAVALGKACPAVTLGTVLLSSIMLLRVLVEIAMSWQEGRERVDDQACEIRAPLLAGHAGASQPHVESCVGSDNVGAQDGGDVALAATNRLAASPEGRDATVAVGTHGNGGATALVLLGGAE